MASEQVGGIFYTVDADTSKLQKSTKDADDAMDGLRKGFDKTDKAASKTQHQTTATAKAVQQLGDEAKRAQNPLQGFGTVLAGLVTAKGALALVTMAESYGEMAERIRMATSSSAEYEMVQSRLLETANATYRPLKEAQELYILTADTLRSMGYNTAQAMDVVDSMSFAFVKNATSAERANGAVSAFTSAMMTGKLEADAWKTIVAAMPTLIGDLAKSTGMGADEIRKMGAEGKLTAQILSEGLRQSLEENKGAAAGMATTVKDAFTAANNALTVYIGEANNANGTTAVLSKAILLLADNLETVVTLLTVVGAGALAKYVAGMASAAISSGAAAMAARKQAADEVSLAAAHVASATAAANNTRANALLGGTHAAAGKAADVQAAAELRLAAAKKAAQAAGVGLIGVLGGPAGIIALAASAASAVYLFGSNSASAAPNVDKLTESIANLTAEQLENRKYQAQDAIAALKKQAQDSAGAVRALEKDYADLNNQMAAGRGGVDTKGLENVKRSLTEARAESDATVGALQQAYDAYNKITDAQSKGQKTPTPVSLKTVADPEVVKNLERMREELALTKLTGEAKARLQAIQRLGNKATAEERAEAEKLAAQIYRIEESRKAGESTSKKEIAQAKEYLKDLRELSDGVKDLTAVEKLHYDIASRKVTLDAKQLSDATSLAQAIDLRAQNERDLALALSTTNAALAAKAQLEADIAGYQADVAGVGMGEKERAELQKRIEIQQAYAQRSQEIELQRVQAIANAQPNEQARVQAQYDALQQIEQSYYEQSVSAYEKSLLDKAAAEANWMNGVRAAMADYVATSQNAAGLAATATKSTLDSLASGLTDMMMGNKTSFADMTRSILQNLVQMAIQAAITKAAMSFMSIFGGGFGGATASVGGNAAGGLKMPGFADGGYTGPGGRLQEAGVVHKGEYVINAESTKKIGLPYLNKLNGYANGGLVGGSSGAPAGTGGSVGDIYVTVNTEGGVNTKGGGQQGAALGNLIGQVVRSTILKEQMPGGLLS